MATENTEPPPTIGFFSVVEQAEYGLFGGYLILNVSGRPLEFHCTAPVKANRAQEILYGPTLKPFLYGEQIGRTLIRKSQTEPLFICTDCEPALAVREFCSIPVVLVLGATALSASSPIVQFRLATQTVAVASTFGNDQDLIQRRWQLCNSSIDLHEPFTRIHEAIEEARRNLRPGNAA